MSTLFGMEDYDYIIPVPLHKRRRRQRGYNQVELIGERLSKATNIPIESHYLVKIVDTPSQVNVPYKERQNNVRGRFDVTDPSRIKGKGILLIDDVYTTGATATESSRTLLRKGKPKYVDVFTLLRVMPYRD